MSSRRTFILKSIGLTGAASLASIISRANPLMTATTAEDDLPPDHIRITASDPVSGMLTMSDKGKTKARRGDVITWVIGPNSGVSRITAIGMKSGDVEDEVFFDTLPSKNNESTNWRARIHPSLSASITRGTYFISWDDFGRACSTSSGSSASHTCTLLCSAP